MKKVIIVLLTTLVFQITNAQLKNTRWQGGIKGDNPRDVILDFKKDTVIVYGAANNETIETMVYKTAGNTFTITKIDGQSDCDNTTPGKYTFESKTGKMLIKLVSDPCYDRSSALDATNWTILKAHKQ